MKLSRLGITIAEVPVTLDWSQARGREQDAGAADDGRLRAADGPPGASRGRGVSGVGIIGGGLLGLGIADKLVGARRDA